MLNDAINLINIINEKGYDAYIVGGFVRDYVMGNESNDVDITTNATPKEIREIFKDSNITHDEYGSVTVIYKGTRYEITTFRKEIKYINNRKPDEFEYIDNLNDDLIRRDFTINALCMNSNKDIIDLFDGKKDIKNKIINSIGDANYKFNQDVLRILRAVRFATQLNFKLSDDVKRAILRNKYLLKNLSYNRKKEELDKIFNSPNIKYGIKLLKELNLLDVLDIPKLKDLSNFNNILGIWAYIDEGYYPFTKAEKIQIKNIKEVMNLDLNDPYTLYHYGLYVVMVVGEMKGIDKKIITKNYNNLPIKSKNDIVITGKDIIEILNIKPSDLISKIFVDIEYDILYSKLNNDYECIKKYILDNYI